MAMVGREDSTHPTGPSIANGWAGTVVLTLRVRIGAGCQVPRASPVDGCPQAEREDYDPDPPV